MSRFQQAINRLLSGASRFELVYSTHSSWPLPPHLPPSRDAQADSLDIAVLDSSFNPPTIGHAALASEPAPTHPKLLLLSIGNADKTPKLGDATPAQRLEMMVALADELPGSVAVGALNEPTFVGKSALLVDRLQSQIENKHKVQLTFLMGWDTIIRVFAPRYYPSPAAMLERLEKFFGQEGSSMLCARRGVGHSDEEKEFLASPYVAPFYNDGKIKLVDLDPEVRDVSSSGVRGGTLDDAQRWCPAGVVKYIREHELYFWKKDS